MHLLTLTDGVLDISRIESGKISCSPVPLDVTAVTGGGTIPFETSCRPGGDKRHIMVPKQAYPATQTDLTGVRLLLAGHLRREPDGHHDAGDERL